MLGATLIIAIGAQNAFVLRQGLKREHVFVLCLLCALADALLIVAGVAGLGTLIKQAPFLLIIITAGGALFLFVYGALAFRRAVSPDGLTAGTAGPLSLKAAIAIVLGLTFLNPHVYLDTVVLLGGLSARYEGTDRIAYAAGACVASFAWFFSLGYGARILTPWFARAIQLARAGCNYWHHHVGSGCKIVVGVLLESWLRILIEMSDDVGSFFNQLLGRLEYIFAQPALFQPGAPCVIHGRVDKILVKKTSRQGFALKGRTLRFAAVVIIALWLVKHEAGA